MMSSRDNSQVFCDANWWNDIGAPPGVLRPIHVATIINQEDIE
jgi:hypothetical protein